MAQKKNPYPIYYRVYVKGAEQPGDLSWLDAYVLAVQLWNAAPEGTKVSICAFDPDPDTLTGFWKVSEWT